MIKTKFFTPNRFFSQFPLQYFTLSNIENFFKFRVNSFIKSTLKKFTQKLKVKSSVPSKGLAPLRVKIKLKSF